MSTPDIRAALAAEPVEEELSAVTTSALLHPAYEPGDGSADGAQMVRLSWWHPVMGCDSLQIVVDNARNILRNRWGHPATPPAPEPGEVGEIADHILAELQGFHPRHRVFGELTVDRLTRAAALLQQLSAPAPVVVPVAVGEVLPSGTWWLFVPGNETDAPAWTAIEIEHARAAVDAPFPITHLLPAHAIPLPQAENPSTIAPQP